MQACRLATLLKRHYNTGFLDSNGEIFKNSYFAEHLWTAGSEGFSFYVALNVFLHEQIT